MGFEDLDSLDFACHLGKCLDVSSLSAFCTMMLVLCYDRINSVSIQYAMGDSRILV